MEALTRLVTDSLVRHGLDRPVDPRRLQWSRWSRCDSLHSLLVVPSKPGLFALAENVMDFSSTHVGTDAFVRPAAYVGTAPQTCSEPSRRGCPAEQSSADVPNSSPILGAGILGGAALQRCDTSPSQEPALAGEVRMLAILQFAEADNMAFALDRKFTRPSPMRDRLASGNCFLRFVILEDAIQRRSICSALNQWMLSSAERATGLPAGFGFERLRL